MKEKLFDVNWNIQDKEIILHTLSNINKELVETNDVNLKRVLIIGKTSLLFALGEYDSAAEHLYQNRNMINTFSDYFYLSGNAILQKGDYETAIPMLSKALELDNFFYESEGIEKFDISEKSKNKRIIEDKYLCNLYLAQANMFTDKIDVAEKFYDKCVSMQPNDAYLLFNYSRNSISSRKYTKAEELLNKARMIDPNADFINLGFSELYSRTEKNREAIDTLLIYLKKRSDKILRDNLTGGILNDIYKSTLKNKNTIESVADLVKESITQTQSENLAGVMAISLLNYYGKNSRNENVANKILEIFLMDPSLKKEEKSFFNIIKKSKNIVKSNKSLDWMIDREYIIKLNDSEKNFKSEEKRLREEYLKNLWIYNQSNDILHNIIDDPPDVVCEPLFFANNNNTIIYVQNRIKKPDIEEAAPHLKSEQLQKSIGHAVASLATIHMASKVALSNNLKNNEITIVDSQNNIYKMKINKFNYQNEFMKRVIRGDKNNRLGINTHFLEFHEKLFIDLENDTLEYLIHGDAYPSNVLIEGTWIDLEKSKIGDPTLDVAQLLNNHIYKNPHFFESYINSILELSRHINTKITESEINLLRTRYTKNILFSNLCQLGHMISINDTEKAKYYLSESLKGMNGGLKDSFFKYIRATKHEELKKAI